MKDQNFGQNITKILVIDSRNRYRK